MNWLESMARIEDLEDVRPEWLTTLADSPNVGAVRKDVLDLVATHERRRLHELA